MQCYQSWLNEIMIRNPDSRARKVAPNEWQLIVQRAIAAATVSSFLYLAEATLILGLSTSYHRKQFNMRIKQSKRSVYLLGLLYDASIILFPEHCSLFSEEDQTISHSLDINNLTRKKNGVDKSSPSLRAIRDIWLLGNHASEKISDTINGLAREVANKKGLTSNQSHSLIVEVLESTRRTKALARRIWFSIAANGNDTMFLNDLITVLKNKQDAEDCFDMLDLDKNGSVSLDEMILVVDEIARTRKSITKSLNDVDEAIGILDHLLLIIAAVAVVLIFIAFLDKSFMTTLATTGTAILSLSFIFASTAQEILASCVFLFIKHPYDIGDRIDVNKEQLAVAHISLLFTVFKRVTNNKLVQIPNSVLNSLWVENISRSAAMKEQFCIAVSFATSSEDVRTLQNELQEFTATNPRDYYPDVNIEFTSIPELSKLELRIDICYKRNWADETVGRMRHSKFVCALVSALRKIPIYGPGAEGTRAAELQATPPNSH
ncbi:hypothetical protein B7463_g1362, partial [Scytalidium lignicola]